MQTVSAIADVMPGEPLPGASERPAIAKVQEPGLERAIVGTAARLEPAAGGTRFERCIADDAGHANLRVPYLCNKWDRAVLSSSEPNRESAR